MMYELAPQTSSVASLEDYVAAIRSRWAIVVGLGLAGLLLAVLIAQSSEDTFTASAAVVVNPTPVGSTIEGRLVEANLDREVRVMTSDSVAIEAAAQLAGGTDPDDLRSGVETIFVPDSDVVEIQFEDTDPDFATSVVNAFAETYVAARNAEQESFYQERLNALNSALDEAATEQSTVSARIGALDSQREAILDDTELEATVRQTALASIAEERQVLVAERTGVATQIRTLNNDITDVTTNRDTQADSARVLSRSLPPETPGGLPDAALITAGTLAGLLLGAVSALIAARLDRSAGTVDAVVDALGVGVLGSVPSFGWRLKGRASVAMLSDHKSSRAHQAREAYRRLRSSIEFLLRSEEIQSLLVTSSFPGEGKSVTSANLSAALAASGQSVALVNADMRRPTLENAFGVPESKVGLSSFLTGVTETLELTQVDGVENLFVVPAGPQPRNPGELLSTDRFELLIKGLAEQVDIIIVDTPPVGATADSLAASSAVGGVLVVVDASTASQEDLQATRADLQRAGANVLGAVMNRDKARKIGIFSRRNRYAYAD